MGEISQVAEHKTRLKTVKPFKADANYKFYNQSVWFLLMSFLHRLVAFLFLNIYIRMAYRIKVEGKQFLKQVRKQGVVVVSNHIHVLDVQMIALSLFKLRRVNWITLEKNLGLSVHRLIARSGGIPIPTDEKVKPIFFEQMNKLLQDGNVLHVCPEGALCENYEGLRPFKIGAFRFAAQNRVPILPVTLKTEPRKDGEGKHNYRIIVGEPIYPNCDCEIKQESESLKEKSFNRMLENLNKK